MAGVPEPIKHHPNATTAGGLSGAGVFIVWLIGHLGVSLGAEDATIITGAITSTGLLIGKRGICGLARLIWKGDGA